MSEIAPFADVAGDPEATLDMLALALAGEFRDVDATGAIASLDTLGGGAIPRRGANGQET